MTTSTKRKKLHEMIDIADEGQLEVIYSFVDHEMGEKYDPWTDEEFLKEIKRRLDEFESGKVKGISWEEVKRRSRLKLMQKASTDPLFLADMNEVIDDFRHSDGENI